MRLYFVRHGQSQANVLNQLDTRQIDKFPLTDKGREQAEVLAEKLRDVPFTAIYSSPLLRARQTAEILNAPHGLDIQIVPDLREHDAGDLEGRSDPAAWQAYGKLFESWFAKNDLDARIPNGESYNDVRKRFDPFLQQLLAKYGETDANILVVAHAGILHTTLPGTLTNITPLFGSQHILGNTALVIAEFHNRTLLCLEWDTIPLAADGSVVKSKDDSAVQDTAAKETAE